MKNGSHCARRPAQSTAPPACRSTSAPGLYRTSKASLSWSGQTRQNDSAKLSASSPDRPVSCRPPIPDQVEILQREADRVHDLVARGAHRIVAVLFHTLPDRSGLLRTLILL